MQRDKGMGFDPDVEEFSIAAGAREIGDDEGLGAALVALDECVIRWSYINIESFFVWILQVSSVVAEELSRGKSERASPGDLERGETVDVRLWHSRLYVITPSNKRRIERATVVCEVEIFDSGFALEVIVRRDILFTLFIGKARADFEYYAF